MFFGDDHTSRQIEAEERRLRHGSLHNLGLRSSIGLCSLILLTVGLLMASNSAAAQNNGPLQDWLDSLTAKDLDPQQHMDRLPRVPLSDEQKENWDELCGDLGLDFDLSKLTAKDIAEAPGKLLNELDSDLQFKLLCKLVLDQMAVGDFGSGSQDEVLVLRPYGRSVIYSADGGERELRWARSRFLAGPVAWDYDRDGIDELVPRKLLALPKLPELKPDEVPALDIEDHTPEGRTPVFSLSGRELARLPGVVPLGQSAVTLDIDGDGWDELLLADTSVGSLPSTLRFRVYGAGGELVWDFATSGSQRLTRGRYGRPVQDCIFSYESGDVLAYHPDMEEMALEDWPPGAVPAVALGARRESWPVLASGDGFLYDTWSTDSTELSLSEPCGAYMMFGEPKQRLAAGEFSFRGCSELAYCPYYDNPEGSLRFYDQRGRLTREFTLGEDIVRIATVHLDYQDMLAVQTLGGVRFVSSQMLLASAR